MNIAVRPSDPAAVGRNLPRSAAALAGTWLAALALVGASAPAVGEQAEPARVSISASDAAPDAFSIKILPGVQENPPIEASIVGPAEPAVRVATKTPAACPATKPPAAAPPAVVVRSLIHTTHAADAREIGLAPINAEAARFKGVQPGGSTAADLRAAWGAPKTSTEVEGVAREVYHFEHFEKVIVTIQRERVAGIAIFLTTPLANDDLAKHLDLLALAPATVRDEAGRPIGHAFPERGVLFAYVAADPSKTQRVVLEPIDPQAFLLRAASRLTTLPAHALVDADFALEINPLSADAAAMRARGLRALGKRADALRAAESAIRLAPDVKEHRLLAARMLLDLADDKGASRLLTDVMAGQPTGLVAARAHELWGGCLSSFANPDYARALEHHQQAIQLAEPLARDSNAVTSRMAREILVDAHLGMARDVAHGEWQNKGRAVAKWLLRGKSLADDMVAKHEADDELSFRVHETAMSVLAVTEVELTTDPWIEGLKQIAARRMDAAPEPGHRQQLRWRLGVALGDAVLVEESRQRINEAIALAETAERLLVETAATVEAPDRDLRVGRLYYRVGAIEAIERLNHTAAVGWYDKALPLLQASLPSGGSSDAARHGDLYVSMAVSYWETGARPQAVKLTREGMGLIERAVDAGHVKRQLLIVPYANLSAMLIEQGDQVSGRHFAELASRCETNRVK